MQNRYLIFELLYYYIQIFFQTFNFSYILVFHAVFFNAAEGLLEKIIYYRDRRNNHRRNGNFIIENSSEILTSFTLLSNCRQNFQPNLQLTPKHLSWLTPVNR